MRTRRRWLRGPSALAAVLTAAGLVVGPAMAATAQRCDDCDPQQGNGGGVPAGPSCHQTPPVGPLASVYVACSRDQRTRVELEAFSSPVGTMGSAVRMYVWADHTGPFGLGGPGWVELTAPRASRIVNSYVDIRIDGRLALAEQTHVCEAASTVYVQPLGAPAPQFQCFLWGAMITWGPETDITSARSLLTLPGLSPAIPVGSKVVARAETVLDGVPVVLGPVTTAR